MRKERTEQSEENTNADASVVQSVTTATVLDSRGQVIRVYDFETHGEIFEKLAHEFVSHTPDATIDLR